MTKGEFASLLGLRSNSAEDMTIKSAIALMQEVLYNLMPDQQEEDSDLRGTTVLEWNSSAILLKDSEGKLYRVSTDGDGDVGINQHSDLVFNLLSVEGSLEKIFDSAAVAELQRLQSEVVAESRAKVRDARRADYERLKAEFEGKDND